jgi:hypothetical protein
MFDKFPWFQGHFNFHQNKFVLDTNVLLSLYRVQPKSRNELLYALKKAKGQLWCPNHVAREFLTSRPGVITEYRNWHKDISAKLASAIDKAFEKLDTTPYVQTLVATVRGAMEGVYGTIKIYGDQYDCTFHKDQVLAELT